MWSVNLRMALELFYGHTVMPEQGIQEGTELAALRGTSAQGKCMVPDKLDNV